MSLFLRIPGTTAARPAAPKAPRKPAAGAFTKTDAGRDPTERRDCAVRALALAARMSYEEAHAALKAAGRVDRRATYEHTMSKAIGRPMEPSRGRQRPTYAQWLRDHPRGRYIVFVTGHYFAVVDGVQLDMAASLYRPRSRVHGHWGF